MPLEHFGHNIRQVLPCLLHAQCIKMTREEHALGFKSCNIPICRWIWILSFLLNQDWIGIDYFLLNVFANFSSILGLQVTVLIRVSQIH